MRKLSEWLSGGLCSISSREAAEQRLCAGKHQTAMDSDPFKTQADVGSAVARELTAVGLEDADEIGQGGFGIVYRCAQVSLDRTVAVKVLTRDIDQDRERFLREQRAMARLTAHPNVVGVLQVGETESGHPYLIMPYHPQGSLQARIRRLGVLPAQEVLRIGVKIAGALESAHRLEVVHRDVKPSNILVTDYGEPALSDFGIAHITGGFTTATGTFTGSPAFTAPEILRGDPPNSASDVYGLGATLFAAITGHAAYERRSGERVVAQFLRIATEPIPDLRWSGIADDISSVIERSMARDPSDRPSAKMLGDELLRLQADHGYPVDDMALLGGSPQPERPALSAAARRSAGTLPLELTSFVGRRAELAQVKSLLATSRLITLTGVGGVGKTRLALRAAAEAGSPDGARLIELGELRDASLLVEVVAAGLGLRDESARSLREVTVDFLSSRDLLLVLDNCEHVVDAVAKLAEALLWECPQLRILATGRERLGINGESVLQLSPLTIPDAHSEPTLGGLSDYDAVALFAERAAAALPGFELSQHNKTTVAQICSRVDGLPLAIELAAARLRAMSPEQILERLADRYDLLTRGSRTAPTRQQTLACSIDWSYNLCTSAEQRMWARLSVFAGSFELQAAEDICGADLSDVSADDLLSALVDKSILIRAESNGEVRFRLLETLRDYGRNKLRHNGEYDDIRRCHLDWYRRLVNQAAAEWFSVRQVDWIRRLGSEESNLRDALEFSLLDCPVIALEITGSLYPFGFARGALTETRRWLNRALAAAEAQPTPARIRALYGAASSANMQGLPGDIQEGAARAAEAESLVQHMTDPVSHGLTAFAVGHAALLSGDFHRAREHFEKALAASDDPTAHAGAMTLMGWAFEFEGDVSQALVWQEKALAFLESLGESVYRSWVLWSVGIGWWRKGKPKRSEERLREGLQLAQLVDDPRHGAVCLEALAWVCRAKGEVKRAVVLMAAAERLGGAQGASPMLFPDLAVFHDDCERRAREALGNNEFDAARRQGYSMSFDESVAFALG